MAINKTTKREVKRAKTDSPEYQAKIEKIFSYIKEGMRSNEIYAIMLMDDESLTEKQFELLLKNSYKYGENELQKDRDYVFQLHMERYEDLYAKNIIMMDRWNQPLNVKQHWAIMTAKYSNALKALESKEKLLGLHDKSISLEFNDNKAILVEEQEERGSIPGYDIFKLTFEEQKKLLDLIRECRTVPIEGIQRVVIKRTVVEINANTGDRKVVQDVETHDVAYELLPDNVVKKMTNIPNAEEVVDREYGAVVIDNTHKEEKPKEVDEIKGAINKKIVDLFKEKLKEKETK